MVRETLGSTEYVVLVVLERVLRDAYGATLQARIKESTGKYISLGALYTTLDRLERKGFVTSRWGEATAERGGRRKRYYRIEGSGVEAVRRMDDLVTSLLPQSSPT